MDAYDRGCPEKTIVKLGNLIIEIKAYKVRILHISQLMLLKTNSSQIMANRIKCVLIITWYNLCIYIIMCAGLWLGLPACIEEFDELVKQFFQASGDDRKQIVDMAEEMKEAITDDVVKKDRATFYVKAMQKVIENGDNYINSEIARVEKLSEGKVSEKKKTQLKERASILTSFQLRMSKKEEL